MGYSQPVESETMTTFSEQISIRADKEHVWEVLADIGAIYRWNPGVVDSRLTSDGEVGLGSERYCGLGGKNYLNETVIEWKQGEGLTMRIMATNLPFKTADIRFSLEQQDANTFVTVSPSYILKFGLLGKLLDVAFVCSQDKKGDGKSLERSQTVR